MAPMRFVVLLLLFTCTTLHAEFRVGVIIPMSGIVADYGEAMRNGIQLARSEAENNVDNVKFTFEDSKYDTKVSIAALHKLVNVDKIDLVYVFGTNSSIVLAPIADELKVPMFALSGEPEVAAGRNYVIDFHNRLEEISVELLKFLRKKNYKKIGIVKTEIQYVESLLNGFYPYLNSDEEISIIDSFPPSENPNFNSTVLKIKNGINQKKYDAIGALLLTGQLSNFYKKLELFKLKPFTFGCDVMGQKEEVLKAGEAVNGGIFGIIGTTAEFTSKYIKAFNKDSQLEYAANTYDFANLMLELFSNENGKLSPENVIERASAPNERQGASGKFQFFDENKAGLTKAGKRFRFPVVIRQVQSDGSAKNINISEFN